MILSMDKRSYEGATNVLNTREQHMKLQVRKAHCY